MIFIGSLTLLFVVYQLWGTGLLTERYQEDLENDFEELVEYVEEVSSSPEVTSTENATQADYSDFLWRPEGEAIAQLTIPALDVSKTVVSGVGVEALRKGPGHYNGTPMPGMPGNAAIAGHRTTWGAPFGRINELEPGDEIKVQTIQGTFIYHVIEQMGGRGNFIVSPNRLDVLDQDFDTYPNRLTLVSCHPKLTAKNRIIVVAELVGEPAEYYPPPKHEIRLNFSFGFEEESSQPVVSPTVGLGEKDLTSGSSQLEKAPAPEIDTPAPLTTPEPELVGSSQSASFGEGLSGDPDALTPTIVWGIVVFVLSFSTVFVGNRWRRWPTNIIAFIPFVVVLSVWFFNLEKTIPS
jgi:sortase A